MIELLFSAFMIGLLGSGHCLAMCGGIAIAGGSAAPYKTLKGGLTIATFQFSRVLSYGIAGALAGGVGAVVKDSLAVPMWVPKVLVGGFMILGGLWIAWKVGPLERFGRYGAVVWKRISGLVPKLLPADTPLKALALGGLWGWLPCGLVYSALPGALATASALDGFLWMAAFGLGTVPMIAAIMVGSAPIAEAMRKKEMRIALGCTLILLGLWTIFGGQLMMIGHEGGMSHHHHH